MLRFSGTLDWDAAGAWLYLAFVLSVLAVGGYGSVSARSRRGDGPAERDAVALGERETSAAAGVGERARPRA